MNNKEEIKRREQELESLRKKQADLEIRCQHVWAVVKYDPEPTKEPMYGGLEGHGSDPYPKFLGYKDVLWPRWSRTCQICGKVEYTYKQAPTKYEPKFPG
jgi:hypothetical protein